MEDNVEVTAGKVTRVLVVGHELDDRLTLYVVGVRVAV
jgi:hypothetical protein